MSSYNKDAIAALADPEAIANYIGMETEKHGSYTFVRCPMHEQTLGKADSKIGNCIITKRGKGGFKCFACGAHGDVFDMVAAFTGCSYPDALKLVGDACGGADSFLEKKKGPYPKMRHALSLEDLALIGLSYIYRPERSDEGRLLYNVSSKKEAETAKSGCVRKGDEFLLYQKAERTNLQSLQLQNPAAYYELVQRKAEEAAEKYRKAKKDCDSKNSAVYKDLLILLSKDGKLHTHEVVPDDVLNGIKGALEKKQKRAEEIQEECRKLAKQMKMKR